MSRHHQKHPDYLTTLTEAPLPQAISRLSEVDLAALFMLLDLTGQNQLPRQLRPATVANE